MRVRILKAPQASEVIPFDVSHFQVGKVYDAGLRLAELLIVCGYASPEMRARDRASGGEV